VEQLLELEFYATLLIISENLSSVVEGIKQILFKKIVAEKS
jgi:hypothetical protein